MHKSVFLLWGTLVIASVSGCGGSSSAPVVSASPTASPDYIYDHTEIKVGESEPTTVPAP